MYGLSCISLHDYKLVLCGMLFLYVGLYRRKISKLTPTEIDYLYFIYVPLNEFRAGRMVSTPHLQHSLSRTLKARDNAMDIYSSGSVGMVDEY